MTQQQMGKLDDMFMLLSNPHRRQILTQLNARDSRDGDGFEIRELVDCDTFDNDLVILVHNHLPQLAESKYIDWDDDQQTVTRGSQFHEIAPLIDLMVAHQDRLPGNWP